MVNPVKISVVIPYYQREPGILRKTILSALSQDKKLNIEIIVVDDESPIPATQEIGDLLQGHPITIVQQPNGGPGSARNKGIESVCEHTTYIAFLDSDDCWLPNHLENAVFGLEKGYDFYFSDFLFPNHKDSSAFERAGKIKREEHHCIDEQRDLFEFSGSMMDQILVKGNVIGTPTVVYRYKSYPDLRFREEFYNGQDYLFWLDFSQASSSIAVSFQKECDCGIGLNIYAGAGWGTERSLNRLRNELFLWKSITSFYPLTSEQRSSNRLKIQGIRESIIRDAFHRIVHFKAAQIHILKDIVAIDPALLFLLPFIFLKILLSKIT